MESSSPITTPLDYTASLLTHSPATGDEVKVQALNKDLRREAPEETRKKLPDSTGTVEQHSFRNITSWKTALSSSPGVSVRQEKSTESPETAMFSQKISIFEEKIKQQAEKKTLLPKEHRPPHPSISEYQTGKVSAESQWMINPHNYSHHTAADWEHKKTPPASALSQRVSSLQYGLTEEPLHPHNG